MAATPRLYSDADRGRVSPPEKDEAAEPYRSPWRRDHARVIHSASFRRLQGKTQVFPGHESDFFRNRLTHSLEVAQVAKSIALRLNATEPLFQGKHNAIEPDIVEIAGLAHDLGHPPFGHTGEEALDRCMIEYGGFEGNAQTLRIVSRLEKKDTIDGKRLAFDTYSKDLRCGLNLTYRTLAAVLKYDKPIPSSKGMRPTAKVQKGYYADDQELVRNIKWAVVGDRDLRGFKTVECSVMDVADDIAYSTYDFEDVFKSGILTPIQMFTLPTSIYEAVATKINERIAEYYVSDGLSPMTSDDVLGVLFNLFASLFAADEEQESVLADQSTESSVKVHFMATRVDEMSRRMASNGYYRTSFTSNLVQNFLDGVEVKPHAVFPQLHKVRLNPQTFLSVEVAKNITFQAVINSPIMQVVQFRGSEIVEGLFTTLAGDPKGRLLPADFQDVFLSQSTEAARKRVVCDFIAGMTDRYALEFYSRLFGEQGLTMHKPL